MGAYDYDDTTTISGVKIGTGSTLITEAGTGVTSATGSFYKSSVFEAGGIISTKILIDITGFSSAAAADIIGANDAANCHLGRITTAQCGTLYAGMMTCFETPTTGEPDIDLYSSNVGTGTENVAITDAALGTETILINAAANWVKTGTKALVAFPADGDYLYLVASDAGDVGVYDAGIFMIELLGYRA